MLAINVVMVNGMMVGCTVSDRWNLAALGLNPTHTPSEAWDMLVRLGMSQDVTVRVRRTASVTTTPSKAERAALTPSLLGSLTRALKRAMGA